MKSQQRRLKRAEAHRGYILLITLVFLAILMSIGIHFFSRMVDHTKTTGGNRNITQAALLAESAMNLTMGTFLTGNGADLGVDIPASMDNQAALLGVLNGIPNMYYVTDTDIGLVEINRTASDLLQIIANGESRNSLPNPLASQRLVTNGFTPLTTLRINDLFGPGAAFRPTLYTLDAATGLLQTSNNTWNTEPAVEKAAAWLEVSQNAVNASGVDIYVQAVADVDGSKSYVQRHIGSYIPSTELGRISLLTESSNVDRRRAVDRF